ncbi:L-seryl-tRNA(Sec) selenium transferase [Parvimonas micra]|uniref:L-seryl-tRNA(Sec) selenium transferase n=1 Tax=Parvimonas TaxID=543311 RepID=UPI0003F682AE|nr:MULTISPECIES: L-seryl-tRNA(Sec) selenium transferase [Parvimonas]MCK6129917.1 L-seryl-tRNA(Sec) selenium transferase [Parvimonas micra]MCK6135563.1 L-seryl-tRNA(Sec) selenium transferase [Parvimonas micra]MCK6137035.1 L-seryl-tRNA(Sec) selenium transferase [Parvimonas micra]MCK6153562.1 L-seryl-tRNA(Sec) selenium transferase [Parvimonas micra]MEB3028438.1 L-seryl-tRNA(Sec) selenium transferase [Parvimonas micra]
MNLYKMIPKVDQILDNKVIKDLLDKNSKNLVMESIHEELDNIRNNISNGYDKNIISNKIENLIDNIKDNLMNKKTFSLRNVVNASGVVIHTNLGRSVLNNEIFENIKKVSIGYSNLEYNLEKGERGSRYSHLSEIIKKITGAEDCMVVNNNAAAVMLILSTIAKGKNVITSRSELVEIGGSFRIPDVCRESGAELKEIGTTNKTHLRDYENAIDENTAALFKVHQSNFKILGFTEAVSSFELKSLKEKYNIPIIEDLGSGVLIDLSKYGLSHEPTVQECIKNGVDIVSFSGDKLLGGVQAGIIVGKKEYIEKMKKNQLTRALRVDKFTLSALEAVFSYYIDEELAISKIPTLNMLTIKIEKLYDKAQKLIEYLGENNEFSYAIIDIDSEVGAGSLPTQKLPSKAIKVISKSFTENELEEKLRSNRIPIITRIYKGNLIFDVRTIFENEFCIIKDALNSLIGE